MTLGCVLQGSAYLLFGRPQRRHATGQPRGHRGPRARPRAGAAGAACLGQSAAAAGAAGLGVSQEVRPEGAAGAVARQVASAQSGAWSLNRCAS